MRSAYVLMRLCALALMLSCGGEDGCNTFGKGFGFGPSIRHRRNSSFDLANGFALNNAGANGERLQLADNAALEVTNGRMSFFMRFREDTTVGADALLAKFDEQATPDVASFVVDQTSCSGSPTRCQYRFNWCTNSDCTTNHIVTTSRGAISNATWTCVGGSIDVGNTRHSIYMDGGEATVTVSGSFGAWVDTAASWAVGNRSNDTGTAVRSGAARYDDVMIFIDDETSAACQWALCNNRGSRTLPASCPTPDIWWDMENGSGSTASNRMNPGTYDGTLTTATFSSSSLPSKILPATLTTNNRATQVVAVLGQSNAGGRGMQAELASAPFVQRFDNSATTWADETADAASNAAGDVNILFATEEDEVDYIAFGWASQFDTVIFSNSGSGGTAGVGGTMAWEYWNGSSWSALTAVSDGTGSFTTPKTITPQILTFAIPGNWATTTLNGSSSLYFIRARVTNVYSTNPIYDWVSGDQDLVFPNRARVVNFDNNGPIPAGAMFGVEVPGMEPIDTNAAPFAMFAQQLDESAGTWVDQTAGFNNATTADTTPFPATEAVNDELRVCAAGPFDRITWDRTGGTQGVGGAIAVEFCSTAAGGVCTAWTAVSGLSDATTGFTAALGNGQVMSWTLPTTWVAASPIANTPSLYCARMRVTTVYTTNPVNSRGAFQAQSAIFPTSAEASTVGFMTAMADYVAGVWTNHTIGIISGGLGSTGADDWFVSHGQTGRLFGEIETRWASASIGAAAELVAIVVYQGENEGASALEAPMLAERWAANIQGIRDNVGYQVEAIVVVSPTTVPAGQTEWATVRTEQSTICTLIPHCTTVAAPEGMLQSDDTHLTTAGYLSLGDTIGAAIIASAGGQIVTP